jgi:hypothetical protein
LPEVAVWCATDADPFAVRRRLYRPSCVAWDGRQTRVLLEGMGADVDAERARVDGADDAAAPNWPAGPHRGRISVRPSALAALAPRLDAAGVRWLAEVGVGTVHVGADDPDALAAARTAAVATGGWLLRERGAPELHGFGTAFPNAKLAERVRAAFDPEGKLSPGRIPHGPNDA